MIIADTSKSPLLSVYKSEQSKVLETPSERFVEVCAVFAAVILGHCYATYRF